MKDPNRLIEKEFHEWLDKCPNDWIREKSNEISNTYVFFRKDVEEDKKFEIFDIGAGEFIKTNSGEVIWGSETFIDEIFKTLYGNKFRDGIIWSYHDALQKIKNLVQQVELNNDYD